MQELNRMIRLLQRQIGQLFRRGVPSPQLPVPPPAQPPPATVRLLDNDQPVVVRPSGRLYWQLAIDAATGPFGQPERWPEIYAELKAFWTEQATYAADKVDFNQQLNAEAAKTIETLQHRVKVKFNNQTGLIRLMRGELMPGANAQSPADMVEIGRGFLQNHEGLLFGRGRGKNIIEPDEHYPTIGNVARFWQKDVSGLVVYGGSTLCGFDDAGELTIVNNSWYPLPAEMDFNDAFVLSLEEAMELAREYVYSEGKALEPPIVSPELKVDLNRHYSDGQVIFPLTDEKGNGHYRPAWVILVREVEGIQRGWEVIVDATEMGQAQPILAWAETRHHATISANIYPNNQNAATSTLDTVPIDLGPTISALANLDQANDFPIHNQVPGGLPDMAPNDLRIANVYYHLGQAKDMFEEILTLAWAAPISPLQVPGNSGPIAVELLDATFDAAFDDKPVPPKLLFGKGNSTNDPPIADPVLDNEVIYHEFAHSVLHVVQPDIFDGNIPTNNFTGALNEGIAFLYGCTLSEAGLQIDPDDCDGAAQWGDFAYGDPKWLEFRRLRRQDPAEQRANYDFLVVYGVFPEYGTTDLDPADSIYYDCGLVWSRTLWDIRCLLGRDAVNAMLLRAMSISGGANTEFETPAEIMIHVDNEYSAGLLNPSHENVLRLLFQCRGIMADGPVHDILAVDLILNDQPQTCLLIATEETTHTTSGCLFSLNNGDSWQPLGLNGPAEVVALATVEKDDQVIIWAASEYWTLTPTLTSDVIIHRYEFDKTKPDFGASWTQLSPLPSDDLTLFSLAAMPNPNALNTFLLFAGTDRGLYKFDGGWSTQGTRIVFDLAITANNQVLAGIENRVRSFDPIALTGPTIARSDNNLALLTEGNQVWIGTAFEGIYDYEISSDTLSPPDHTLNKPIHSLWVDASTSTLYAGTNDGVYRRSGGNWTSFNHSSATGETIEQSSVSALYQVNNLLFAGTAQRGLWRIQLDAPSPVWERLAGGLPRLGRLVDVSVPAGFGPWSADQFATGDLSAPDGLSTHILYIPDVSFAALTLRFTVIAGTVTLAALNYIAPYVDLAQLQASGLQSQTLLTDGTMDGLIKPGYYVLTVKATAAPTTYQIKAELS